MGKVSKAYLGISRLRDCWVLLCGGTGRVTVLCDSAACYLHGCQAGTAALLQHHHYCRTAVTHLLSWRRRPGGGPGGCAGPAAPLCCPPRHHSLHPGTTQARLPTLGGGPAGPLLHSSPRADRQRARPAPPSRPPHSSPATRTMCPTFSPHCTIVPVAAPPGFGPHVVT